jgi:glycosyltransferase involved in cell wall biosynthesis
MHTPKQSGGTLKSISVVTACYNEEENVREVYEQVKQVMAELPGHDYEHIFIDNASKDRTVAILRELAKKDGRVKVIINTRNFGHIRSPCHAILQAQGDVVISIVADLQDPPSMIKDFVGKWEEGYKVVMGVKKGSAESILMFALRRLYYRTLRRLSDVELVEHFTGFGLYDRQVIDILRSLGDPYPYFRGLIADIGFEIAKIEYVQPGRKRGITKNNFYTLYDMAMLGLTSYTKVPLRLATMVGFGTAALSLLAALFYLVYKLVFWRDFSLGLAPLVVGIFFFSSVQLIFLGIVGEYVGSIHTYVRHMPLVVEKERINF